VHLLTESFARLFSMTTAIAWLAMSEALKRTDSKEPKLTICEQIITAVGQRTGSDIEFGKRFAKTKQDFADLRKEDSEGDIRTTLKRKQRRDLRKARLEELIRNRRLTARKGRAKSAPVPARPNSAPTPAPADAAVEEED